MEVERKWKSEWKEERGVAGGGEEKEGGGDGAEV